MSELTHAWPGWQLRFHNSWVCGLYLHERMAVEEALASARSWLSPLAERVLTALEDPTEPAIGPPPPPKNLESELLRGERTIPTEPQEASGAVCSAAEFQQLCRDFEGLLSQRAQLRAQLVVEQERRERAEAELVAIGAQWLGTDTQAALRRRAEAEKQRELDAEKERIMREAAQRIAKVEAEKLLLQQQLGKDAPSGLVLKLQLRRALQAELAEARSETQRAVEDQLVSTGGERDRLAVALRQAEARHATELEMLRDSLRKASAMLQQQFDDGFQAGLKQASALGSQSGRMWETEARPSAACGQRLERGAVRSGSEDCIEPSCGALADAESAVALPACPSCTPPRTASVAPRVQDAPGTPMAPAAEGEGEGATGSVLQGLALCVPSSPSTSSSSTSSSSSALPGHGPPEPHSPALQATST